MWEQIASKAGRIIESVAAKASALMREELNTSAAGHIIIDRAGNVPDAFGRFTIDLGPAKRLDSNPGNRPGTFRINSYYGGGEVQIEPNGAAIVRANGTTEPYAYRSFRENEGTLRYMLYKPDLDAKGTLATVRDFFPGYDGDVGYFSPLRSEQRWDLSENAEAINQKIPLGSTPIGIGELRQTWHTPDDQALQIGPWRKYPNIPEVLQPNQNTRIGSRQLEWFPVGENLSVTKADAHIINEAISRAGFDVHDTKLANYLRTKDGRVWRIDPDEIVPHGQIPGWRMRRMSRTYFGFGN